MNKEKMLEYKQTGASVAPAVAKENLDAFLVRPPSNCCPVCAREHDPKQPHALESLFYRLKFNEKNGRMPTEKDAMAHCSKEVKEAVRKQKEYEKSLY